MKSLSQSRSSFSYVLILLLVVFFCTGCAALNEAQQRRQERIKKNREERHVLYARATSEYNADQDGLVVRSDHYTLTFHETLLQHEDFDEAQERQDTGQGILVSLESFYRFVHNILKFEPNYRIDVLLLPPIQGRIHRATTASTSQISVKGDELVKQVTSAQMRFPLNMVQQKGTQAHELTHAFTEIYNIPSWFAEGLSVLVEVEYVKRGYFGEIDIENNIKVNPDGANLVQDWESGTLDIYALTKWKYDYSYSLVSALKSRFGEDFYARVFRLIEEEKLYEKTPHRMNTSVLVYYLSKVAGEDLTPFFENLKFNVRSLTKSEILSIIRP
jgi:hypothetical protein